MRGIGTVGGLGLVLALAAPVAAQAPVDPLGEVVRDPKQGMEFRLPRDASPDDRGNSEYDHRYIARVADTAFRILLDVRDASPEMGPDPVSAAIDRYREHLTDGGVRNVEVDRGLDSKSGSVARIRGTIRGTAADGSDAEFIEGYYYAPHGRLGFIGFYYFKHGAADVRPVLRAVLLSFRLTYVPDDRCDAPADATRTDTETFSLLVGKGVATAAAARVKDDCEAALAYVRALTGGPALPARLKVHLHADATRIKKASGASGTPPAAVYVPEGRLVLASGGGGGTALGERAEAVLDAYCDAWLGTPYGRPPWLALGLRECVRATKAGKDGLAADVGASRHAAWLRKNARKAGWLPARAFLQAPPTEFLSGKPEHATYAMGLLLAATRATDERTRTLVARFGADFVRHRDADLALDDALKGVDLDALDKATRDLLAKG